MENGGGPLGLEDGVIDVDRMLVEHNDVSVDGFMCFSDKVIENTVGLKQLSRNYGGSDHGFVEQRKDILRREVLDVMPNEEAGYFRLQNEFCNMGDEYLLGVEFGESITNLDYSSGERLQTSVSDSLILASCAGTGSPWKSDLFRMEMPGCQSHQLNVVESQSDNISNERHEYDKPLKTFTSCTLKDLDKFRDISSSFEEVLSEENGGSISTFPETFPDIERNIEFKVTKEDDKQKFQGHYAFDRADTFPSQKRSRKPTQRYIDEFEDLKIPKKQRGSSSSTLKVKDLGVKGAKKCRLGFSAVSLPVEEETDVKAIQVPFAAVVQSECSKSEVRDTEHDKDGGHSMTRTRESRTTLDNQRKKDDSMPPFHQKRSLSYLATHEKKRQDGVSVAYLRKRSQRIPASRQNKRGDFIIAVTTKKKDEFVRTVSEKKRDDFMTDKKRDDFKNDKERDDFKNDKEMDEYGRDECYMMPRQKKRDDFNSSESIEEVGVRRKHHILWTIAEVRKLLQGVSEYGVGRWSRIKKLYFPSSEHRTSVDLKDKWRNLLKASGILERSNGKRGKKRKAQAWRPLPKSIICQVCELAAMHPYPKGRSSKISHKNQDSADRSTDITLSDYRKILRAID